MMREEIIGNARLILGDCREVLPLVSPIDVILTDPPYGINYQSGYATDSLWGTKRKISNDHDATVRNEVLRRWDGLCTPRIIFGSRKVAAPEGTRTVLIWDKGSALGMGALDLPWKPSWEEIYILGSGFCGPRNEGAVLYCPPVQSMAKNGRLHPNEKPVALLQRLLLKCPTGTVVDPFMGSGSTIEAAMRLGRPSVGIEIDPRYFDIACRRIERVASQGDMFTRDHTSSAARKETT